jgi:hypothetical protein
MLRVFLPISSNEARLVDQIDTHIGKVVDLGFLRRVSGQESVFEVRRIVKAFVDAEWLAGFDEQLARYAAELAGDVAATDASSHSDADSRVPADPDLPADPHVPADPDLPADPRPSREAGR